LRKLILNGDPVPDTSNSVLATRLVCCGMFFFSCFLVFVAFNDVFHCVIYSKWVTYRWFVYCHKIPLVVYWECVSCPWAVRCSFIISFWPELYHIFSVLLFIVFIWMFGFSRIFAICSNYLSIFCKRDCLSANVCV